jgi:hypothetical protein
MMILIYLFSMNRNEAIKLMLQGYTIEGIDGAYCRHKKHGGCYLFRYNFEAMRFEHKEGYQENWRIVRSCIYLFSKFEVSGKD